MPLEVEPDYKKLFEEALDALEDMVDGVKTAAPHFLFTLSFLRRRRDCKGAESFDEGCNILNGKLLKNIAVYDRLKKEQGDE